MIEYSNNDYFGFEIKYGYTKSPNGLIKFINPTEENTHVLKYIARGPSFELISEALTESTYINHITGVPFILTSLFYKMIFEKAIVEISFDNDDIESFKVSSSKNIHYSLVKMVSKNWIKGVL